MASNLSTRYAYRQLQKSIKEARNDIEYRVRQLLVRIAKDTTEKIREYVDRFFYTYVPESSAYNRLRDEGGFLSTIRYEIDNSALSVKIYCDWSMLRFGPDSSYGLPHHISPAGKFTTGLYDYIMYGEWDSYYVPIPNSIKRGFDGISDDLQYEINEWLNNYLTDKIANSLRVNGINIEIKNRNVQILGKM